MKKKEKIESQMRQYFGIPMHISLQWGLIVEEIAGEEMARPALVIDCQGHKLALDILQARFVTASSVLGCKRRILVAEVSVEDDIIELSSEEGYHANLTEEEVDEVYFVRRYSSDLFQKVARGEDIV